MDNKYRISQEHDVQQAIAGDSFAAAFFTANK